MWQSGVRIARAIRSVPCAYNSVRSLCVINPINPEGTTIPKTVSVSDVLPGGRTLTFTDSLKPIVPSEMETIPAYQILNKDGNIVNDDPGFSKELCLKMYEKMVTIRQMDNFLYKCQRQGRISFYMTCTGEEATHIGSAHALQDQDTIFAQYREQGVLLWRGFPIEQMMHQCFSNARDLGKGRQMPVHYGSKEHNFQTISSPLATQIPQAVGAAYALKIKKAENACVAVYFGEGAASEGDFHAALNFAATLQVPVIFFCRNNGYAISTPVEEQFRGDGIASRGIGYGIESIRVDGNDLFAVYNATKRARDTCIRDSRPVLVETMSYRVGHHSTSDDSSRYRSEDHINWWEANNNPITRFRTYLRNKQWWSDEEETELLERTDKVMKETLQRAQSQKKPSINELFTDVYDTVPLHLQEQKKEFELHLSRYSKHYPMRDFES